MSILIQIAAVVIGLAMILWVLDTMKKKKLNEAQSIFWLIGAVGIIILGIFPQLLSWMAGLLGIWWEPAILLFFLIILLLFITFNHTREISVLLNQLTELSMQIALLKYDNEKLRKKLDGLDEEKEKHEYINLQ